ncbi:MAG: hypothetical protein A2Y38_15615 [Spirochaetes bacterium GWB1_59_5]|nr:MAG: hypothetical protein A2Y38_15615 [Spirochaetes bacterium GWB1_59_5]
MGLTNFPNGISSFGVPVMGGGGIPASPGNFLFVDYANGDDGRSVKSNSAAHPLKTIAKAYDLARTNKDDVIVLVGSASHALTEMLTVAKNRVHFVGMDGAARMYGQNAKISLGVTTAATDLGAVLNTGVRNSFQNIKFTSANTKDESLYTFLDGGEYLSMVGCEIYKETDLDQTGASELVMNGDSAQLFNCTIGSLANAISGAIVRANVLMTKGVAGAGKVARDVTFDNCFFWKKAGHVNNRFVYGANADDVERMLLIRNSVFFSQKLSTAVPAQCVAFGAEQSAGYVLVDNCSSIGNTKLSTTTGVHITGAVPTYATSGIAVAS